MLRDRRGSDDNFILDSWCGSYRHNIVFGAIPKDIYFKHYRKFTVAILSISSVLVACNPNDEDQIYGFCVYRFKGDLPILSYVFIKQAFRRFGIAEALILGVSEESKVITHIMPSLERWLKSIGCVFDPFIDWKDYYEIRYR
jgi:GNAT superfamily N-acetyltransferase